nr:hypothetical protein [Nanoarchaeum sp.]
MLYDPLFGRMILGFLLIIVISQTIKGIIESNKSKKTRLSYFLSDGGIPSTHSALVSALTFTMLLGTGFSYLTLATFVFSLIIIRDSFGLRLQVGKQKQMLEKIDKKDATKFNLQREGHTVLEVLSGIILGLVIISLVLSF